MCVYVRERERIRYVGVGDSRVWGGGRKREMRVTQNASHYTCIKLIKPFIMIQS